MNIEVLKNKLVEYIENAKTTCPEVTDEMLLENGKVFYMNGNDGTDYDWICNGHSCEFMSFFKSTNKGFFKIFVERSGYLDGYVYKNEGTGEAVELDKEFIGIEEAKSLAKILYRNADIEAKYDTTIEEINFE